MKTTNIIRRVDDLGRVVIPREIRKTLGIREGEALEIFTGKTETGEPMVGFARCEGDHIDEIHRAIKVIESKIDDLGEHDVGAQFSYLAQGMIRELKKRYEKEKETKK